MDLAPCNLAFHVDILDGLSISQLVASKRDAIDMRILRGDAQME